MDPFTIATTVTKITSMGLATGKAIYDFSSKYQAAPRNVVAVSSEIAVISASLSQIQALLLSKENPEHLLRSRPEIAATLDTTLTGCMVLFSCLDAELHEISKYTSGQDSLSWKGKFKVVWKQETFQELLDGIRGQQIAINTLIQLLQMDSLAEITRLLQEKAPELTKTVEQTNSIRRSHPSVTVVESIYNEENRESICSAADSILASSEVDFDFDDIIVNSTAYRRAFAAFKSQNQRLADVKEADRKEADRTEADVKEGKEVESRGIEGTSFYTGMLYRKRKRGQGYAKRFFTLDFTSSTLSYYADHHSSVLRGAIPLSLAAISANGKTREFYVDSGAEQWHLKALNKTDFEGWRDALIERVSTSSQE